MYLLRIYFIILDYNIVNGVGIRQTNRYLHSDDGTCDDYYGPEENFFTPISRLSNNSLFELDFEHRDWNWRRISPTATQTRHFSCDLVRSSLFTFFYDRSVGLSAHVSVVRVVFPSVLLINVTTPLNLVLTCTYAPCGGKYNFDESMPCAYIDA